MIAELQCLGIGRHGQHRDINALGNQRSQRLWRAACLNETNVT
jgi:hypothetical protein